MPGLGLIGARVRERREALGLRQAQVARAAGISGSYLNLIEHDRRRIGGVVLERLAQALGMAPEALSGDEAAARAEDLRAAAAALPDAGAEMARAEEVASRYPGWAALIAAQARRAVQLEALVEALNDRIGRDPHLGAALHEVLSAASSVRSTAAILAETEDIDPGWRRRFHANLQVDSERLAAGAEALVAYLDAAEGAEVLAGAPQDEIEEWLAGRGWHLQGATAEEVAALATGAARSLGRDLLAEAARDAEAIPDAALAAAVAAGGAAGADPVRLAQATGAGVLAAMRRIALAPAAREGLVICDGAGALVLRKPLAGFAMPRGGAACPLWPLYAALARPGLPVACLGAMPGTVPRRFALRAFAESSWPQGFAGPELRRAGMLIMPSAEAGVALDLGGSCRICPRQDCPARREPAILSDMTVSPQQARGVSG